MPKRKKKSKKVKSNQLRWFLDTSVFINSFLGNSLYKQEIDNTIHLIPCYTSFFVFYEFKRSVIRTLIELYFLVDEEGPVDAIATYKDNFKTRENGIILGAISRLLAEGDISSNKQKALANLEALILNSLQDFRSMVNDFVDNKAKCPLAKASISTGNVDFADFTEAIKCNADCTIAQFWKNHKGVLRLLTRDDIAQEHKKNKGFRDMLPVLHEVLQDHDRGQMIRNCTKLGDVIIAIEMPDKCTMLTFDKSFESLCPLIGKEVQRLPSLSELKKRAVQV